MKRLWMSQSCFSLGFLFQNALWKLSTFCGYNDLYILVGVWKVKSHFSKTELAGDLASWLDWVASSSCEPIEWLVWTFYLVVLQLARWFSFSTCFTRVHLLAAYQLRATREIHSWVPVSLHNLEHFFTLSHTLPLHNSHLNTKFLHAELQANLARNKTNIMVD